MVLSLPDVTELVADEVVVRGTRSGRILQQDRPPQCVTAVAPEVREAEEQGGDEEPDTVELHGPRIESEPVEPRSCPLERRPINHLERRRPQDEECASVGGLLERVLKEAPAGEPVDPLGFRRAEAGRVQHPRLRQGRLQRAVED